VSTDEFEGFWLVGTDAFDGFGNADELLGVFFRGADVLEGFRVLYGTGTIEGVFEG
jgi:hypothetical protein